MVKARLFLDVDGVLNFFDKSSWDKDVTKSFKFKNKTRYTTYRFNVVLPVLARLDAMLKKYDVELVWASTWNDNLEVLKLASYFGYLSGGRVPPSVVPATADNDYDWTLWKSKLVLDDLAGDDVPFVWVDDEAVYFHAVDVKTKTPHLKSLFLSTDPDVGLSMKDLDDMDNFFASL